MISVGFGGKRTLDRKKGYKDAFIAFLSFVFIAATPIAVTELAVKFTGYTKPINPATMPFLTMFGITMTALVLIVIVGLNGDRI